MQAIHYNSGLTQSAFLYIYMDSRDFKLRTLATVVIYQTIIISDTTNLVFAKQVKQRSNFVIHKTFSSY